MKESELKKELIEIVLCDTQSTKKFEILRRLYAEYEEMVFLEEGGDSDV